MIHSDVLVQINSLLKETTANKLKVLAITKKAASVKISDTHHILDLIGVEHSGLEVGTYKINKEKLSLTKEEDKPLSRRPRTSGAMNSTLRSIN